MHVIILLKEMIFLKRIYAFVAIISILVLVACDNEKEEDPFVIPKTTIVDSTYTETNKMIDGYVIIIKTGNVCDLWGEKVFTGIDHEYTLVNKCILLQGVPFLNIDGYAVDIQVYFKNVYVYNENDIDVLEYIGISINDNGS
jgi:hypothetical protein